MRMRMHTLTCTWTGLVCRMSLSVIIAYMYRCFALVLVCLVVMLNTHGINATFGEAVCGLLLLLSQRL